MYLNGEGVEQNYAQAHVLFEKARRMWGEGVHKGLYESATNNLAMMHLRGQGGTSDPERAFELFRDVAVRGDAFAAYQVGQMYESGTGVGKDASEAIKWYRQAAELHYAKGIEALHRLESAPSPSAPPPTATSHPTAFHASPRSAAR
jgi:TPR repeat protein